LRKGYTLVVCEKPDAAKRISEALAETQIDVFQIEGTKVLRFGRAGEEFVVSAALGHIFGVSDPFRDRSVYPVFDFEWFPNDGLQKGRASVKGRIESFKRLSSAAAKFINACDYDIEGETIGFNVLRYACGGREREARRARFSTLTRDDLVKAFDNPEPASSSSLALAGRTRHALDFAWGVNLSRALSESMQKSVNRYRTLSIGRVQGPALSYVVDREVEIRTFVPLPFWRVRGIFDVGGVQFEAAYAVEKIPRKVDAEVVRRGCEVERGMVSRVTRAQFEQPPAPPFNIGDLQKEAYRAFGYAPSRTLQIAERLYLDALISYPRTDSQKLPPSIGYAKILEGLAGMHQYSRDVDEISKGILKPTQGQKEDPAHPAVYPTGERPKRELTSSEASLLDLVVRRFLSTFGKSAFRERVTVIIKVGEFVFKATGSRVLAEGWLRFYGAYAAKESAQLPPLKEGNVAKVLRVEVFEEFSAQPLRYNQSSLLEKMERENLGTKATRADIISTLIGRGYITGERISATNLGFAVVGMMKSYSPAIISTKLTRDIEERLQEIERGTADARSLVRETIRVLSENLAIISSREASIGLEMSRAISAGVASQYVLGPCPVCRTGKLKIVSSRKTQKRFVGCTNYPDACRASAPLPQKGAIRTTTKTCERCAWPIVYVVLSRYPWRLCVNPRCPSKLGKRNEVQTLRKRG